MKRAVRELAVGTALALAFGGVATALLSDNFDQQPRFSASETTQGSSAIGSPTDIDHPTTVAPIVPSTKGERRLVKAFGPFDLARESQSAYSIVTMAELGKQFPRVGFIRADRVSMTQGEVSVLVASPETLILATLDGTGCVWLHELGGGPEIAHSDDPTICAASNSPFEGWAPITAA